MNNQTSATIIVLLVAVLLAPAAQAASLAPAAPVTRLELALILHSGLDLSPGEVVASFPDLPPAGPARDAISSVHRTGLMSGFPSGQFRPQDQVTRAQAVAVLLSAASQDPTSPAALAPTAPDRSGILPFTDVPAHHWAGFSISQAWQKNLIAGVDSNHFSPDRPVTGWELAQLVDRFLGDNVSARAGLTQLVHKDRPLAPEHSAKAVPVLLYHHLAPAGSGFDTNGATITPEEFAWQMQYLADHGYTVLSAGELQSFLLGELNVPKRSLAITFDDGYASNLKYAFPVLNQHKFPAIFHIITATVPDRPQQPYDTSRLQSLSWPELKQLSDSGLIAIAAHSHNLHTYLPCRASGRDRPAIVARITDPATGRPETEPAHYDRILSDLLQSRRLVEEQIKKPVTILAYPYGVSDSTAHRAAAAAGYTLTFSTQASPARRRSGTVNVPRLVVKPGLTLAQFQRLLTWIP